MLSTPSNTYSPFESNRTYPVYDSSAGFRLSPLLDSYPLHVLCCQVAALRFSNSGLQQAQGTEKLRHLLKATMLLSHRSNVAAKACFDRPSRQRCSRPSPTLFGGHPKPHSIRHRTSLVPHIASQPPHR